MAFCLATATSRQGNHARKWHKKSRQLFTGGDDDGNAGSVFVCLSFCMISYFNRSVKPGGMTGANKNE